MNVNQQIKSLLLWQKSRGLLSPTISKAIVTPKVESCEVVSDEAEPIETRQFQVVAIEGNQVNPKLLFLGFSPQNVTPFNQTETELFLKMMAAINLSLDDILIANISDDQNQSNKTNINLTDLIFETNPKAIIPIDINALSSVAEDVSLDQWNQYRGKWTQFRNSEIKIIPTWHPKALLNHPPLKRETWNDLQDISKFLSE